MMAEQVLKKLEDKLNCPICLEMYSDPKQLICDHIFCQKCLIKLVNRDQLIITCPNCRQVTPVPANGVANLRTTFHINQFLEIVEDYKKASAEAKNSAPLCCPEHGEREVELYCDTCEETICIMKYRKHHSHNYEELNTAFDKYKREISESLKPFDKQLATIKKTLLQLDMCCGEVSNQQATLEVKIQDNFRRLHQMLNVRKTELLGQVNQLTQAKLKCLAAQRQKIETTQERLSNFLNFIKESLETDNQGKALTMKMKSTTARQAKELTTIFLPETLVLDTTADITFSAIDDITAVIQNYGRVYDYQRGATVLQHMAKKTTLSPQEQKL